jgi:hypothetical protein
MLKKAIAICLLVTLISSNFSRFFLYAGFELNHKYIAENFCINKSRPWMHCNGHCYFMRKIKEAQENEKKQDRANQQNHNQEALPAISPVSLISFKEVAPKVIYPKSAIPKIICRSYAILLPPKVV